MVIRILLGRHSFTYTCITGHRLVKAPFPSFRSARPEIDCPRKYDTLKQVEVRVEVKIPPLNRNLSLNLNFSSGGDR
ncbi:hypothetical protein GSbR_25450 [Geobacter sp. SVR]|nr:hypothetical protein GSVR_25040 [Geobacter sp. SVR]GCF85945.1 hypothetical protein GSbR_25450 [Geobacter sp. SVR]